MTRPEAMAALRAGKKLTHTYFTDGEFVYQKGLCIYDENGYSIPEVIFWHDSKAECFNEGWSVVYE